MPSTKQNIVILILAAGPSSRLGRSKQLVQFQGKPLLRRICEEALKSLAGKTLVVLGANAEQHKSVIEDLPLEFIEHNEWEKGMGSSIKAGLHHILKSGEVPGAIVISVCDQPYLNAGIFNRLIALYNKFPENIIASTYTNETGVPVLFAQKWFDKLLEIPDTKGAKSILQLEPRWVKYIAFEQGLIDIDTPTDLEKLKG